MLGTVGALVLTLVLSLPLSLSYADYTAANQRFSNTVNGTDYSGYAQWWSNNNLSQRTPAISDAFLYTITLSITSVATSVLLDIIVYFHLIFNGLLDEDEGVEGGQKKSVKERAPHTQAWWKWAQFVVGAEFALLCIGLVEFFVAYWIFVRALCCSALIRRRSSAAAASPPRVAPPPPPPPTHASHAGADQGPRPDAGIGWLTAKWGLYWSLQLRFSGSDVAPWHSVWLHGCDGLRPALHDAPPGGGGTIP